jgi:hypothetical protein
VKDAQPSAQDAFRRIRTLPTFVNSLWHALVQVNEFAQTSRTVSPSTHRRSRQRIAVSFWLVGTLRLVLRLPVIMPIRMRPNRLLPPNTFSTTSTRASWIPDFLPVARLSPRAGRGTERFTTPDSLRRALRLVSCGAFSSPGFPRASGPYLWHLCRLPACEQWRFRTHCSSSGPPRLLSPRVREDHTMSTTRSAFHRQVIASSGSTRSFTDPATLPPRFGSRRSFARRALSTVLPVTS